MPWFRRLLVVLYPRWTGFGLWPVSVGTLLDKWTLVRDHHKQTPAEMWWHTVTHRRGKWRGNWRMEWVASTLHTTSEHGVSSINTITTADAHTSTTCSRLNWRPRADLNGLVRFAERRNLRCAIKFELASTSVVFVSVLPPVVFSDLSVTNSV